MTTEWGLWLLEFVQSNWSTIVNTPHKHKMSWHMTWHLSDALMHNQTDYILKAKVIKLSINKAKTRCYPGVNEKSNHDLVLTSRKLKLKSTTEVINKNGLQFRKAEGPDHCRSFAVYCNQLYNQWIDKDMYGLRTCFSEALTGKLEVPYKASKMTKPQELIIFLQWSLKRWPEDTWCIDDNMQ